MVQVQFETTPADFQAFQQFAAASAKGSTPKPWRAIAIVFCVGLSFGLMGFSVDTPTVVLALCIFGALWLYIRRQTARVSVPSERGAILGPRQTSLDDLGVREQSANHTFMTAWNGVLAVEETPAHVFVMIDRFAGYVVPKRSFANSEQLGAFLAFARAHAGGTGRRTSTGLEIG